MREASRGISDTIPPRILPARPEVVLPIYEEGIMEIPVIPLFVDRLPIVQSIYGYPIGRDTRTRTRETIVIGRRGIPGPDKFSFISRISEGHFGHNRSHNYQEHDNPSAEVVVIDGQEYSGASTKGGDFRDVFLAVEVPGFRINGLLTRDVSERIVQVSEWLRSEDIKSEVIWSVSQPEDKAILPWITRIDDATVSMDYVTPTEMKRLLLERAEEQNRQDPEGIIDDKIDIDQARAYLASSDSDFMIVNRVTTVPFRVNDIGKVFRSPHLSQQEQLHEFSYIMNHIFSYLNRSPGETFNYLVVPDTGTVPEEWRPEISHFLNYFAKNLGQQIGKMHSHGVVHDYLHDANIVADGTFCDIDSIRGVPLGDAPPERKAYVDDVQLASRALLKLLKNLSEHGMTERSSRDVLRIFLKQYVEARWGASPDLIEFKQFTNYFQREARSILDKLFPAD